MKFPMPTAYQILKMTYLMKEQVWLWL